MIEKILTLKVYKLFGEVYSFYLQYLSTVEGADREEHKIQKERRLHDSPYIELCGSTYKMRERKNKTPQKMRFRIGKKERPKKTVAPALLQWKVRAFNYGITTEDMIAEKGGEHGK